MLCTFHKGPQKCCFFKWARLCLYFLRRRYKEQRERDSQGDDIGWIPYPHVEFPLWERSNSSRWSDHRAPLTGPHTALLHSVWQPHSHPPVRGDLVSGLITFSLNVSQTHGSILCGAFQMSWKQTDVSAPGVCVLLLLKTPQLKHWLSDVVCEVVGHWLGWVIKSLNSFFFSS